MNGFTYYTPTKVVFGRGTESQAGALIREHGGSRALLTDLLRGEWGFSGAVVTDACLYPHMDVTQMVYAGGDLSLDTLGGFTGGNGKRRSLLAAAQDPARRHAMVYWLQNSAKHILYMVAQTME